jgi:CRISPR-associated protein Cst2
MVAEAGKTEGNDAETETPQAEGGRKRRVKGTATKRRGALEVTRAISLTPFVGDITFNAKSGEKSSTSLYGTEVHATRYQYGFALTPRWLHVRKRTLDVVDAIISLSEVAGNQSRFLYDIAPESVIFRWTGDLAPRLLHGFRLVDEQPQLSEEVRRRIEAGDIEAKELIVGGGIAKDHSDFLIQRGALVCAGVKQAAEALKARIRNDLDISDTCA